jgi:DNA-binding NtrC family response regulator
VTVLILEDDDLVAQGLMRGLGYLGCEALHAETIEEAQRIVGGTAEIGMALIDVGLGRGQRGEDFLAWLRREHPRLRRVVISGLGPPSGFVNDPPREMFLRKPFGQAELAALLKPE